MVCLFEETAVDGLQLWVCVGDSSTAPSGCWASQSSAASAVTKKRPGLQVVARTEVLSISSEPGIEITAVVGETSETPACGSTVRRMMVLVVGQRDSIRAGLSKIAGNSRVSAAHHVYRRCPSTI